jgi:hypothetical protein
MAENMFDVRKNDRRKQIIEENMDVANQYLATNPNAAILQNENDIEEIEDMEEKLTEELIKEIESAEVKVEQPIEQESKPATFKLSLLKKEKIKKDTYNYYIEDSLDEIVSILSVKMGISKSEVVSLLLKSAILTNDDIQNLSETDIEIKNILEKLKK